MRNKTHEYMLKYAHTFVYYDSIEDKERKDAIPQTRYFDDIFEARRYAMSLPDNCENICIYQLVEKYEDEA